MYLIPLFYMILRLRLSLRQLYFVGGHHPIVNHRHTVNHIVVPTVIGDNISDLISRRKCYRQWRLHSVIKHYINKKKYIYIIRMDTIHFDM